MQQTRLGIIVALPREAASLLPPPLAADKIVNLPANSPHLVGISGIGGKNASHLAKQMVAEGISGLISWGCAGGLSPEVKNGDLVIPERVVIAEKQTVYKTSELIAPETLSSKLRFSHKKINIFRGALISSTAMISSPEQKAALTKATIALAVDMESYAIAGIAEENNLPFQAIKAIADPWNKRLPPCLIAGKTLDQYGDLIINNFFIELIKNPLQIIELINLGRYFNNSLNSLRWVASNLVNSTQD